MVPLPLRALAASNSLFLGVSEMERWATDRNARLRKKSPLHAGRAVTLRPRSRQAGKVRGFGIRLTRFMEPAARKQATYKAFSPAMSGCIAACGGAAGAPISKQDAPPKMLVARGQRDTVPKTQHSVFNAVSGRADGGLEPPPRVTSPPFAERFSGLHRGDLPATGSPLCSFRPA